MEENHDLEKSLWENITIKAEKRLKNGQPWKKNFKAKQIWKSCMKKENNLIINDVQKSFVKKLCKNRKSKTKSFFK